MKKSRWLVAASAVSILGLAALPSVAEQGVAEPEDVVFDGDRITQTELRELLDSEQVGSIVHLAGGNARFALPINASMVAFRTEADADAWLEARGVRMPSDEEWARVEVSNARLRELGVDPTAPDQEEDVHAVGAVILAAAESVSSGRTDFLTFAFGNCPNLSYGARIYEHSNCGGSYLGIFQTDAISSLGTYGWNDRASSIVERAGANPCFQWVRIYQNSSYGGVSDFYWNFDTPSNLGGFNDEASSLKAGCS